MMLFTRALITRSAWRTRRNLHTSSYTYTYGAPSGAFEGARGAGVAAAAPASLAGSATGEYAFGTGSGGAASGADSESGAFDAAAAEEAAPVTMSGAFDACGEAEKVVQAALWPSSSQWLRWHTAPQYVASLQRAHFFAPLAKHMTQICGGSAPRNSSSDATAK